MTLPSLVIGFLISSILGSFFHLIRGGGPGRLLLLLIMGWAGFWGGHAMGERWNLDFFSLGPLHLGMAIVVCIIALGFGYWLSLVELVETK